MTLQFITCLLELSMIVLNSVTLANKKLTFIKYWPFHTFNIFCLASIILGFTILYLRWKTIVIGTMVFVVAEMIFLGYLAFIMN